MNSNIKADHVRKYGEVVNCAVCKEVIYGIRYNLEITVLDTTTATSLNYCEACYINMKEGATE